MHLNFNVLAAIAAAIWAVVKWRSQSLAELHTRRMAFLIKQDERFQADQSTRAVLSLLLGRERSCPELASALRDAASNELSEKDREIRKAVDQFLQSLLTLVYAVKAGGLTLNELLIFGSYYEKASKNEELRAYCASHGFADIVWTSRQLTDLEGRRFFWQPARKAFIEHLLAERSSQAHGGSTDGRRAAPGID
jgi:hypothetical protein